MVVGGTFAFREFICYLYCMSTHKSCETHCCINHGCKYGHEDCPVENGTIAQAYLCEYCDEDDIAHPKGIVINTNIILRRDDGTIANIPDEDAVKEEILRILTGKNFNGWSVVKS